MHNQIFRSTYLGENKMTINHIFWPCQVSAKLSQFCAEEDKLAKDWYEINDNCDGLAYENCNVDVDDDDALYFALIYWVQIGASLPASTCSVSCRQTLSCGFLKCTNHNVLTSELAGGDNWVAWKICYCYFCQEDEKMKHIGVLQDTARAPKPTCNTMQWSHKIS